VQEYSPDNLPNDRPSPCQIHITNRHRFTSYKLLISRFQIKI